MKKKTNPFCKLTHTPDGACTIHATLVLPKKKIKAFLCHYYLKKKF